MREAQAGGWKSPITDPADPEYILPLVFYPVGHYYLAGVTATG
jgi:hypothetical protein